MAKNITADLGHTGLTQSYGMSQEDFLREWRGREKTKRIQEMLFNSPVIGSLRLGIEMPIRGISWTWASDKSKGDRRLRLLNDSWDNMSRSWNDHIIDALLFIFYGWSLFTINYERVGGRVLWRKFKPLGHDTIQRWLYADDGGLSGVQQNPWLWPEPIPIERCLLYRFRKTKDDPEGESILRPAWVPYYYVKNIQQTEAIGVERNLAGLPVITPPIGADMTESTSEDTDYGRAAAIVRNIRQDEQAGVILPPPMGGEDHQRWRLELLSGGGQSKVIDTDMIISRYEKRMLMAALAQFLILGQDQVGSLSLSTDQTDFFTMAVNAAADIIAETVTKYAIPRLMALNGLDAEGLRLEHSPAGDIDLQMLSEFLSKTADKLTWMPEDEEWLRSVARLPERKAADIAEEKERRKAEQQAIAQAEPDTGPFGRPQPRQDEMAVGNTAGDNSTRSTRFQSDASGPADELDRQRLERRLNSSLQRFLVEQQGRVERGAKRIRSNGNL